MQTNDSAILGQSDSDCLEQAAIFEILQGQEVALPTGGSV